VRHLEHRQLFLAAAVVFENLARALFRLPQVEHGHAVLAEQTGQEIAAIRRDQAVVGLLASRETLRFGLLRIAEIGDANLAPSNSA
jgi:hypothetical protein